MPGPSEWIWWKDAAAIKELSLAADKSRKIDAIYNTRQRELKHYVDEFLKQRDALEQMTRERVVDEDTYSLQVTHVEALRSKISESRTLMLYRMYRQLDPAQYQKLRELRDQRRGGRGGGRP